MSDSYSEMMEFRESMERKAREVAKHPPSFANDPQPAWVRCSERLPEQVNKRLWSRDVLATIKQKTGNRFVVVAYYHYGCEQWKMDYMVDDDIIDFLSWQPLPPVYEGEK